MTTIITQPGRPAHQDAAARRRRDRLAPATAADMEKALTFLGMIDPEAFEIALTACASRADEDPEDEGRFPVCRECGGLVGIFLACGLRWQHFRGDDAAFGIQETYDPGHPAQVTWLIPGEDLEDL